LRVDGASLAMAVRAAPQMPDFPVLTCEATPLAGLEIGGATVRLGVTQDSFGFTTLQREGDGWLVVTRDVAGRPTLECTLSASGLACGEA
jgi:hypothetical protein